MSLNSEQYELIAAYLSGNLNPDEKAALEKWRKQSVDNENFFRESEHIWKNSSVRFTIDDDSSDQEWNDLKAALDRDMASEKGGSSLWLKIAASILLLFAVGYILVQRTSPKSYTRTASNTVETFYLPDSTLVWLNANSTLSYTDDFGKNTRRTHLRGEAYFKVSPDKNHPFLVQTEKSTVTVLGTSFNVKENSNGVTLSVAEGVVRFEAVEGDVAPLVVTKNEEAVLRGSTSSKKPVTDFSFDGWRNVNNPGFADEAQLPAKYLTVKFEWRKNGINQSVIKGTLANTAKLASYKNILLRVKYTRPNGTTGLSKLTIPDLVSAGEEHQFDKRLLDIFTDTQRVDVTVESAEVQP